jgi:hypothetical protein
MSVVKLNVRSNIRIDPAVDAYYAIQNAWELAETERTLAAGEAVDRAYEAMADAIPTTRDGLRRKIEMSAEFASSVGAWECDCGCPKIDERFEDLLQRNLETLAQGFDAMHA